jgi:hypothetical protein
VAHDDLDEAGTHHPPFEQRDDARSAGGSRPRGTAAVGPSRWGPARNSAWGAARRPSAGSAPHRTRARRASSSGESLAPPSRRREPPRASTPASRRRRRGRAPRGGRCTRRSAPAGSLSKTAPDGKLEP